MSRGSGSTTASAIEISTRFAFTGTIEKIETFNSKGGGLKLIVQTAEADKIIDLLNAKGNVVVFDCGVSTTKAASNAGNDEGQLDLSDSIPEPQEA